MIKIALSGAPCSGKTTSLRKLIEYFAPKFNVLTVPEAATIVFANGVTCREKEHGVALQTNITKLVLELEKTFENLGALSKKPTMLICDRGILDGAAFIDAAGWSEVLNNCNLSHNTLLKSYDLVIHLVTAAYGAEQFYSNATNSIRLETIDQARQIDDKLRHIWHDHHNFYIIDNSTNFELKIGRVINIIEQYVNKYESK